MTFQYGKQELHHIYVLLNPWLHEEEIKQYSPVSVSIIWSCLELFGFKEDVKDKILKVNLSRKCRHLFSKYHKCAKSLLLHHNHSQATSKANSQYGYTLISCQSLATARACERWKWDPRRLLRSSRGTSCCCVQRPYWFS